jgi:hypothetical protein
MMAQQKGGLSAPLTSPARGLVSPPEDIFTKVNGQ